MLVDDEFSTGRTVLNTIRELHARHPRDHYVVVALVDLRSAADRRRLADTAAELGVRLDLVATASGAVQLPADVQDRAERLIAEAAPAPAAPPERPRRSPGSTWTGPPGSPTAAGTGSPPATAPDWTPPCPAWPDSWPTHCPPRRGACWSSASKS